jgi:hypothetical protein
VTVTTAPNPAQLAGHTKRGGSNRPANPKRKQTQSPIDVTVQQLGFNPETSDVRMFFGSVGLTMTPRNELRVTEFLAKLKGRGLEDLRNAALEFML